MKVVILAGGLGTRISEYSELIPKPMIQIGNRPILWHIMNRYAHYGHKDFYLALGYKSEIIKEYFLNFGSLNSDFMINLKHRNINYYNEVSFDWNVSLIDTGLHSMTGGRLRRLRDQIGNEPFMLTYGDGVSNINLNELEKFHFSHGKMVTVSAVHPTARFGELSINNNQVTSFKEKPQIDQGWINGGFFVINPEFFDFLDDDNTILEKQPLESVANIGELMAFKHEGFWQCMDTKRDCDNLNDLLENGNALWLDF